jgi:hypothetical protein
VSQFSKDVLADPANRKALQEAGALLPVDTSEPTKADVRAEKDLQKHCEGLLEQHHFIRLTADNVERVAGTKVGEFHKPEINGWFAHWHKTKKNPLMADLVVFPHPPNKPVLQVELKVRLVYQPGQGELIGLGQWRLAQTVLEFERLLHHWQESEWREVTR